MPILLFSSVYEAKFVAGELGNIMNEGIHFMIAELDGDFNKIVYQARKNGNKTASSAGKIFFSLTVNSNFSWGISEYR